MAKYSAQKYGLTKETGMVGRVPEGQSPGFEMGTPEVSMNQLPSNARVVKSAKSNLMEGSSQNRGSGR